MSEASLRRRRWRPRRWRNSEPVPLAIFDDVFPYEVSGFRLAEYQHLLRSIPLAQVYSTLSSLRSLGVGGQRIRILDDWKENNPDVADRLTTIHKARDLPSATCFYTIFVNNAMQILPIAERTRAMFSFTLYPGGGLRLGSKRVDQSLRRLASSPSLFKVIVTQPAVLAYLRQKQIFDKHAIEYVFGGVLPHSPNPLPGPIERQDGPLRIGFIANRYHPHGLDKGFDIFVGAAVALLDRGVAIECHFVGPWSQADLGVRPSYGPFIFHGPMPSHNLQRLLSTLDICVFPTRRDQLGVGSFDGFPTGAAVEAGLAGCAVLTTNPLQQQTPLLEGHDYLGISAEITDVRDRILELHLDRVRLHNLRLRAQARFAEVYSPRAQLGPRERLVLEMMESAS